MPLSKAKQAEYMKEYRKRISVIPKIDNSVMSSVIPNSIPLSFNGEAEEIPSVIPSVIPKSELTFPVFGHIKSRYWAERFFEELGS